MAADIRAHTAYQIAGRPLGRILPRLNALMMVLKSCKDKACTHPWRMLHPDGRVHDLKGALDRKFDDFYEAQPTMSFSSCGDAYYREIENQQPVRPWPATAENGPGLTRQVEFDYAMHWHLLV